MITCPNCGHPNPDSATQCEACFAPLSELSNCNNCGASVAIDALFCAQCGVAMPPRAVPSVAKMPDEEASIPIESAPTTVNPMSEAGADSASLDPFNFEVAANLDAVPATEVFAPPGEEQQAELSPVPNLDIAYGAEEHEQSSPPLAAMTNPLETAAAASIETDEEIEIDLDADMASFTAPPLDPEPEYSAEPSEPEYSAEPSEPEYSAEPSEPQYSPEPVVKAVSAPVPVAHTQIQQQPMARLTHVYSQRSVDVPLDLDIVHIGKPNDRIPPDLDVSGFPDSDVVSRIHADLRREGNSYYLEDTGSSNGTYVNNQHLRPGDRFLLRTGDRISLGKEDKVSFIFQLC